MKRRARGGNGAADRDKLRREYDFSRAVRGATATRYADGANIVVDPAVLDSKNLRETLRALSERRLVKRDHDNRTLRIPGISEV